MDVPTAPVPVSGISVDKKPVEELVVLSDADVPKVDDVPTPHQNGSSEKSPAENTTCTPITTTGEPETVAGSSPPTPSANHDDGPERSTTIATNDDVKTVSLNNENDDRVDSIEVGGQGDTASVAATSNSTPAAPSTNDNSNGTNNGVAAVDDPKDLEQSTMNKERSDSDPVVEPEANVLDEHPTTEIVAATTEPDSIVTNEDEEEGGDDNIADDAIEVATGNNKDKISIVTENGQGDDLNKSSPSSVVVEEHALTEEIVVEAVEDSPSNKLTLAEEEITKGEPPLTDTAIPETTDKKDSEIESIPDDIPLEEKKALESEESVQVIPGEDVPEEDSMMISNVQTVDQEDQPETADDDEEEPLGESLQLEDSQEEGDFDGGEEEDEDGENQIETIDIDTDDEDGEGEDSLVGPPVDEDEDDVEEVESLGEEYEEFEVSDEENSQEQDLAEGSDIEEEESISDGTSDDERFAQMKESNRGAKRKMYGSPTTKSAAKERRVGR